MKVFATPLPNAEALHYYPDAVQQILQTIYSRKLPRARNDFLKYTEAVVHCTCFPRLYLSNFASNSSSIAESTEREIGKGLEALRSGASMDLSLLKSAMVSESYDKIADICDELMLEVAAKGIAFQAEWPYAVHILGHIYVGDVNAARFIWKSIPVAIKESQPEVLAAWRIGQRLWTRDYTGVYEAIRSFNWSPEAQSLVTAFSEIYTKKMFQLLLSSYSTISTGDTALFLGMNDDEATNYVLQRGWSVDPTSQMFIVKKQPIMTEQKLDPSKLQRLTDYVFHLEQ